MSVAKQKIAQEPLYNLKGATRYIPLASFFKQSFSMKTVISLSLFILLSLVNNADAQIRVQKGKLTALKGIENMAVKFTYDGMSVGKFKKESDYLDKKATEYNKKEAGKGDQWRQAWVNDRKTRFEPKFIELFEKNSSVDW